MRKGFAFVIRRKTSSARLELFTFGISNGDPGLDEEGVCICYFESQRKTSSARLELFTFGISNGDPGLDEEGVCICYFESRRKTSLARLELFTFGISNGDHRKQVLSCFFLFFRHRDPGIWEYGGAVV